MHGFDEATEWYDAGVAHPPHPGFYEWGDPRRGPLPYPIHYWNGRVWYVVSGEEWEVMAPADPEYVATVLKYWCLPN